MNIYVIGDSISIQYGPYLEKALSGVIGYSRKSGEAEALLNLDIPVGANGGDSSMVLEFLEACAASDREIDADTIVINCGLHDIKKNPETGSHQVEIDAYRENLTAIVETVTQKMQRKLVWVRTTPCDENVHNSRPNMEFHRFSGDCEEYNQVADEVMAAKGIPSIDLNTFTANLGTSEEIYCDHVHFKDEIRIAQAGFIAGWLTRNLQG